MKKLLQCGAVFLCTALLLTLTGCLQAETSPSGNTDITEASPAPADPSAVYSEAVAAINAASNLTLNISTTRSTTIRSETYTETSVQQIVYSGLGTQDISASVTETLTIGDHSIISAEYFAGGTGYAVIDGIGFSAVMTGDEFMGRYAPAVLLNEGLYEHVEAEAYETSTAIHFSQATAAEDWLYDSTVNLTEASGTAVLDENGNLLESSYSHTDSYGDTVITVSTVVEVDTSSVTDIQLPEDASGYTAIEYLDGPKMLERACGYLLLDAPITAASENIIKSDAFMVNRSQTTALDMYPENGQHLSRRYTSVTSIDTSQGDNATSYYQDEIYRNNEYLLLVNGQAPKADKTVTASSMHSYCQDLLVSTILMPQYITSANVTSEAGTRTIHFTANEELASSMCASACDTLYNDPALLSSLSSAYETAFMEAYLTLDSVTGLPLASGLSYSGIHTIEGFQYPISMQTEQTYILASTTAYDTIMESLPDTTEPSTEPSASAEETTAPSAASTDKTP